MAEPVVRRIRAGEVDGYREVRLRALRDAPAAFGEPYDLAVARPLSDYEERVERNAAAQTAVTLVAEADAEAGFVGLVGGHLDDGGEVDLVSMWVAPAYRGTGLAERLVDGVVAWARERHAPLVRLRVAEGNIAARRFYERYGFVATGDCVRLRSHPELDCERMDFDLEATS